MNSSHLIRLLKLKHAEDVFVPECKDGPTLGSTHYRLDGWAMQKSWTNPVTYGYECKVSRNDFLRDDKWQNYLTLCSDFYFVCPWGLIQPDEVGDPAGLLWSANNGGDRLWVKKKAKRRADVSIPETMWRYLLMRLDPKTAFSNSEKWESWLAQDDKEKQIGRDVSKKLRQLVTTRIEEVKIENMRLQKENAGLTQAKAILEKMGISPHNYNMQRAIEDQVARTKQAINSEIMDAIKNLIPRLERVVKIEESLK